MARAQYDLIKQTRSGKGVLVTMHRNVNAYRGAQPYFTVSYRHKGDHREGRSRFTPFTVRAKWLYDQMAKDVTDPAVLGLGPKA